MCVKAFIRRASAYVEREKFKKAKADIKEVLKLKPKEKTALRLQKEIEIKQEHAKKAK